MIAATGETLIRLLEDQYPSNGAVPSFEVIQSDEFDGDATNAVTLFLYRVGIDSTRRHVTRRDPDITRPPRVHLALELRYLLTAWGQTALREHQILTNCMSILERNSIVSGDRLNPTYHTWEEGDALKVSVDELTNEDMLRLWDSFEPNYQLSVPYLVRTVRIAETSPRVAPLVDSRTNVWTPRIDA